MKIISFSDVITNSSSEVFVIHSKPEFQDEINESIPQLLANLCDLTSIDIDETMEFEVANKSEINEGLSYYVAMNDLLIHSCGDNSIPGWLMDFIENIPWLPNFIDKFQGYYAKDLGEKNMPYYDWNAPYDDRYKTKPREIESVQRVHLG